MKRECLILGMMFLVVAGCNGEESTLAGDNSENNETGSDADDVSCGGEEVVVEFNTADGVKLAALSILWLYPTTEPWSEFFSDDAPSTWSFVERGEQHGTTMFDGGELEEQTTTDILVWLTTAFAAQ